MQPITRTHQEIDAELQRLHELHPIIPPQTYFGDDNKECVAEQIQVITRRMTFEQVTDKYEDEADYLMSAVLNAYEWLNDGAAPPSDDWYGMLTDLAEDQEPVRPC